MKILALTKYPRRGASSRLRTFQYIAYLQAQGHEVRVSELFDEQYLDLLYLNGRRAFWFVAVRYLKRVFTLLTVWRYDLVWLEKELFPYLPAVAERLLSMLGIRYVVDYDDAIFHSYDMSQSRVLNMVLGRKIDVVMNHATCVIAGNQYLADRARSAGSKEVVVIPTVVDTERYEKTNVSAPNSLVIGWIGSPSTQTYLAEIAPAIEAVCKEYGAVLRAVGATPELFTSFPEGCLDLVPWSEDTEASMISSMTVGVMPLLDGPWERGKCGYKLIQYMASGVPVIASPVGVNVEIVEGSGSGLLADSITEWTQALRTLLGNPALRTSMGSSGRAAVQDRYSLQGQSARLSRVLVASGRK